MAAPIKDNLDYIPLDCCFFNDDKIKGTRVEFGNDGIVEYLYFLSLIYNDRGYYAECNRFTILGAADTVHVEKDDIKKFLEFATEDSLLFDSDIYKKFGILTSRAVQRRYQKGKKTVGAKRKVIVRSELWLLSEEETEPYIEIIGDSLDVKIIEDKSENNEDLSSDLSASKVSKENKSKVSEAKKNYADAVSLTDKEYQKLVSSYPKPFVDKCIDVLNNYKLSSGKKYKSDYYTILHWVVERVKKDYPDLAKQKPAAADASIFENPWSEEIGRKNI